MSKKAFYPEDEARWTGWIPKGVELNECLSWEDVSDPYLREGKKLVLKIKGRKDEWNSAFWPPDKVEVIVRRVRK